MNATIDIYNKIKYSVDLLPIPTKCHYVYNLRDLSKVFYGIGKVIFIIKANELGCKTDFEFIRLWAHECKRVF